MNNVIRHDRFLGRLSSLALLAVWVGLVGVVPPTSPASVGVPGSPIPESSDFATLVLRDPWDMQQYSDVSQYLNESGQRNLVANPAVANGEFTGQSVGDANHGNAYFFPLFPGYENAMLIGKIGHRYPINAASFHCLYIAMQVNSPLSGTINPDQFRIFWFADDRMVNGIWGQTKGITLYGDTGPAVHSYRVYKVDLASPPAGPLGTPWTSRSTWEGLRIDPTVNAGVTFAVDWVRLTTCASNLQTITWTKDPSITAAWIQPSGTSRWIRVASGLNGSSGSAAIDVQGIQPGSYRVGLGAASSCCIVESSSSMVIEPAPIADFVSPSFFSGPDYASQAGNPWDFNSPSDVASSANMSYSIHDSVLDTTIPSGPYPAGVDAQFFLNTPQPIVPAHFRYLSFRMFASWSEPWQNVPLGMIVRVVWGIEGVSGQPTNRCWLVSHDVPFDIGWQTYWIDLGDSYNGAPLMSSLVDCPASLPSWTNTAAILNLRFDPNEDITGSSFHQELDWFRLTAIDSVARGVPYLIQLHLNRDTSQIVYYYTTDRANPTQAVARPYVVSPPPPGSARLFLPLLRTPLVNTDQGGLPAANVSFRWDTSAVSANTYYICARVTGGGNTATYCSEAPVIVH